MYPIVCHVISHAGSQSMPCVESRGGISPPRAPRTVREPLNSYGSRCSAVDVKHPVSPPAALACRAHGIDGRAAGSVAIGVGVEETVRSTLAEALEGSLLLFVVDASDPTHRND